MTVSASLPPSYDQSPPSAHSAEAHKEVLIQGADEPGTITISRYSGTSRTPIYQLTTIAEGRIELRNALTSDPVYILHTDPNAKVYTIVPALGQGNVGVTPDDTSAAAAASIKVKPEKISRTGGWVYKAAIPSPVQEGVRCVWKGSIFQSVELYAKDAAGQRTPIAHYVRKTNGEHFLRLYSTSHPQSSSSSSPLLAPFPDLPLLLASLYPFLALYWKYTRVVFTSDKKLNEWSATAQPSKWDARILGKAPSTSTKGGGKGSASQGETSGARGRRQDVNADADEKTLADFSSSDEGNYDSDDDLKGSHFRANGAEMSLNPGDEASGEEARAAGTASGGPTGNAESPGPRSTGKSPSRLGKMFGRKPE